MNQAILWVLSLGHIGVFLYLYFAKSEWEYVQLVAAIAWMAIAKIESLEKKVEKLEKRRIYEDL